MALPTYTVKKGDTLSEIAWKYNDTYHYGSTVKEAYTYLAKINAISDPDKIVVGQVLYLTTDVNGNTPATTKKYANSGKVTVTTFGLQSNTDRTLYVFWKWTKANTENYLVQWYYDVGDGKWFIGSDTTATLTQSTYDVPLKARSVRVRIKPVSKQKTVNNKQVNYWNGAWSTYKSYTFKDKPQVPSVPTVELKDFTLTARLENIATDINATTIEFQVVKDDSKVFSSGKAKIATRAASYVCTVAAGGKYKVRCRSTTGREYSDWSDYSSNVSTKPEASSGITVCRATDKNVVYLEWKAAPNCTSYELEYTTELSYFDGSDKVSSVRNIEFPHYTLASLDLGHEYFFRVRAVNDQGNSSWTSVKSVILGKDAIAPTTWSSTNTAITGEPLILYWVHNSEDESVQQKAEVEYTAGGTTRTVIINTENEPDDEKTTYYEIDTSQYSEGVKIEWRVRTAGVTKNFGEWSIQRSVDVHSPPTISIALTDANASAVSTITSLPFYIAATTSPSTQTPVGYHVSITALSSYETVDDLGNSQTVVAGSEVYSKQFNTKEQLLVEFNAGNVNLENNIDYVAAVLVSMDSGLTATAYSEFIVEWTDDQFIPNAEIGVDMDNLTAYIHPYCEDDYARLVTGVTLSVYRREFNGEFTELASGLSNDTYTYITDPHPSLDYARYRIVATSDATGAVSFYDVPGYPIQEKAVIIQWDEAWTSFDTTNEDELEQPAWTGSFLRLPYNIDVSDSTTSDAVLVKYIGRKRPVSYYGTQLGETSTWNVAIEKSDIETLYAIRRLSAWMGDVYVREPSGSGYWAHVNVSYNQKHRELTIPVTFNITRVSGGI